MCLCSLSDKVTWLLKQSSVYGTESKCLHTLLLRWFDYPFSTACQFSPFWASQENDNRPFSTLHSGTPGCKLGHLNRTETSLTWLVTPGLCLQWQVKSVCSAHYSVLNLNRLLQIKCLFFPCLNSSSTFEWLFHIWSLRRNNVLVTHHNQLTTLKTVIKGTKWCY